MARIKDSGIKKNGHWGKVTGRRPQPYSLTAINEGTTPGTGPDYQSPELTLIEQESQLELRNLILSVANKLLTPNQRLVIFAYLDNDGDITAAAFAMGRSKQSFSQIFDRAVNRLSTDPLLRQLFDEMHGFVHPEKL